MSRRFYLPQPLDAEAIRLTGAEAHHLTRVLRFAVGDEVTLFDGSGVEARARIERVAAQSVELIVLEHLQSAEPAGAGLVVATAVPKGERFDWLVEKATELGVERLIPIITTRSVVEPGAGKLDRLRRTIIEASKQCGRSRLMELAAPLLWRRLVETEFSEGGVWVADPSGEPLRRAMREGTPRIVVVGPEGGFTDEELDLARNRGGKILSLGRRILRIETAALAMTIHAGGALD